LQGKPCHFACQREPTARDQILDERLAYQLVLGGAFVESERVFLALLVDAETNHDEVITQVGAVAPPQARAVRTLARPTVAVRLP